MRMFAKEAQAVHPVRNKVMVKLPEMHGPEKPAEEVRRFNTGPPDPHVRIMIAHIAFDLLQLGFELLTRQRCRYRKARGSIGLLAPVSIVENLVAFTLRSLLRHKVI